MPDLSSKGSDVTEVTQEELDKLHRLPVEDLLEAFNDRQKGDELVKRLGVSKAALLRHAEDLAKQLVSGLVVVNRV